MIEKSYLFIPESELKKQALGLVINTEQFVLPKYSNTFPPPYFSKFKQNYYRQKSFKKLEAIN